MLPHCSFSRICILDDYYQCLSYAIHILQKFWLKDRIVVLSSPKGAGGKPQVPRFRPGFAVAEHLPHGKSTEMGTPSFLVAHSLGVYCLGKGSENRTYLYLCQDFSFLALLGSTDRPETSGISKRGGSWSSYPGIDQPG